MLLSNTENIPLPLAVWLSHDSYDFIGGKNRISATSLLKPTRQFVLSARVPMSERNYDVSDFIASRMGHAFHDSIEMAWIHGHREALKKLGISEKVIDRIKINPDPKSLSPSDIPIYLEQRVEREIEGFTVSGKFDMVIEGQIFDIKSTSVYSVIMGSKEEDYIKQASIYRWLSPDLITSDQIHIQHIFTDWSRSASRQQANYPPSRLMNNTYDLIPLDQTEAFIRAKIKEIKDNWDKTEADIPFCTDKELWRSDPVYKYYSNPDKTDGRATKNFDNLSDANKYRAEKGKGVVLTVPGKVKACSYCPAFDICSQKDLYDHD